MEYEFYHHGIQGQKWGVRRYQNEDGTLTPAGKSRYSEAEENWKTAAKEYKNAKRDLKRNKISHEEFGNIKDRTLNAKIDVRKSRVEHKKDIRRQKGKELHAKGETTKGNIKKAIFKQVGIEAASFAGKKAIEHLVPKELQLPYNALLSGGYAVTTGLNWYKTVQHNINLNMYLNSKDNKK